jgi:predicted transcriptional regulator
MGYFGQNIVLKLYSIVTVCILNRSSNFYSNSLTLLVSILELVQERIIAADIARRLKMNKSHVSYYIKKSKECGFIKQVTRDAFAVLEVTQPGKNFLDQYNKNNPLTPICRLENIQFTAQVTQMPMVPVDWKKIQMHNWVQYNSRVDNVKVRLNLGKIPTLELLPTPVDGNSPHELLITTVYECVNALSTLQDRTGLRVGKLEVSSKPEWLVYDPVAKAFCKHNGQVTYEGIGKVNASKPRRIGEIEFHDPRNLIDYMNMPITVKNIETKLDFIIDKLNK